MSEKKVHYMGWFPPTKAGYERFGRALVACNVELKGSMWRNYVTDPRGGSVHVIIRCTIGTADLFVKEARLEGFKYKSPTYFNRGTIFPIYNSAADEISGVMTPLAQVHLGNRDPARVALGAEVRDAVEGSILSDDPSGG